MSLRRRLPRHSLPTPWRTALALTVGFLILAGCAALRQGAKIDGPAGRLAVDDGGSGGIPVLFVHSFAGSSAHWQGQLEHLRATRRAVAMDLRGHGGSDAPAGNAYAVSALADDIGAVADRLELRRFVLVGHSMGGAAAIAYAGRNPDRVAGLVMVGTPGKAAPMQAQQIMAALNADYDKTMAGYWDLLLADARPEVRQRLEAARTRVPREASMAIIAAIFAFDPLPVLDAYPGPKLIVDAARGDQPNALFRQAPGIEHRLIPASSHWVQLDQPQAFEQLLDAFLSQVR